MQTPDYILQAVATELLRRQDGKCRDCESTSPKCVTYIPKKHAINGKDVEGWHPTLDDMVLMCEVCVEVAAKKAQTEHAAELKRLQDKSEIEEEE